MRPLNDLPKRNCPFPWNLLCEVSPDTIKIVLTKSPTPICPHSSQESVSFTDTSGHSWSGVLTQEELQ